MSDYEDKEAGDLRIRIDRTLCVGFGDCVTGSPTSFKLDDEGIAVFVAPESATRDELLAACDSCPVDAITVWDSTGKQVVPS